MWAFRITQILSPLSTSIMSTHLRPMLHNVVLRPPTEAVVVTIKVVDVVILTPVVANIFKETHMSLSNLRQLQSHCQHLLSTLLKCSTFTICTYGFLWCSFSSLRLVSGHCRYSSCHSRCYESELAVMITFALVMVRPFLNLLLLRLF